MIVRKLNDLLDTPRHVAAANWESTRLLLAGDKMGFSLHITRLYAGCETHIWYRNHLEAVYCVSGEGEVVTLADNVHHPIAAGTAYALDQHDDHLLRAFTEIVCVCVFNPPLRGREVHDENGVYAADEEAIQ